MEAAAQSVANANGKEANMGDVREETPVASDAPATGCSAAFRRAVAAERARLMRSLEKARAKVREREDQLSDAEQRATELEERLALLEKFAEPAQTEPGAAAGGDRLAGSSIRETAVRVLLTQGPSDLPVHYRHWLALLEDAGYAVAGKRPDAVFLNQVTRSPVVKAAGTAGFYEIDFEAPERLRNEVREAKRVLAEAARPEAASPEELTEHSIRTRELSLAVLRAQRALEEAVEALAPISDADSTPGTTCHGRTVAALAQ
jgi:hypothetical protein